MGQDHHSSLRSADLFGTGFDCHCGRRHDIAPRSLLYTPDAVGELARFVGQLDLHGPCGVLYDARTRQAAGDAVAQALRDEGREVIEATLADPADGKDPICDEASRDLLADSLGDAAWLMAVGSGVINDLAKWIAFDTDRPYVCFATAASMNGYASANVAPSIEGVKTVLRARPPVAVVSDPEVWASAPQAMTAAGLGDLLAKNISNADWALNRSVFGDYYCSRAVALIAEIEPAFMNHPQAIARNDHAALGSLMDGLLLTGVAMTMAGTSSPASGGEHLISHALDMMSAIDGQPHDLHGRQVGVGTVLAAELYRRVLECESPCWDPCRGGVDRAFWGPLADVVAKQFAAKQPRLKEAAGFLAYPVRWDTVREELAGMVRPPEEIRDTLRAAQAAWRAEDLGMTRDRLCDALLHGREMRERFTVLDLAWMLGILPDAAEEIVADWV